MENTIILIGSIIFTYLSYLCQRHVYIKDMSSYLYNRGDIITHFIVFFLSLIPFLNIFIFIINLAFYFMFKDKRKHYINDSSQLKGRGNKFLNKIFRVSFFYIT